MISCNADLHQCSLAFGAAGMSICLAAGFAGEWLLTETG
jgi:hypothetical protein